jgi:hypothetical protein
MLLEGRGESIHIIIGTYTDMNGSWSVIGPWGADAPQVLNHVWAAPKHIIFNH